MSKTTTNQPNIPAPESVDFNQWQQLASRANSLASPFVATLESIAQEEPDDVY